MSFLKNRTWSQDILHSLLNAFTTHHRCNCSCWKPYIALVRAPIVLPMSRSFNSAEPEWPSGLQRCAACGTDGRGFEPWTSTNVCRHFYRYVEQKGSAAMLTSIQLAGVTPEVNLRNPLCAGEEAHKGIHPGFETLGRCHQKSKTGVSVAPQKGLVCYKKFFF